MDAATKVAKQRLSVLQLAEALGNAAEAHGAAIATQPYDWWFACP